MREMRVMQLTRWRGLWMAALAAGVLAACGGGSDDAPAESNPPTLGRSGGTVQGPSGATVIVPPGALAADVTVRVALDGGGAPAAMPASVTGAGGAVYAITPHGTVFEQPVEVRIPAPSVTLQPNQQLVLAKAQPGGEWELQPTELQGGMLTTQVSSFSYFTAVVVTYPQSLVLVPPWAGQLTLNCGPQDCVRLLGPVDYTAAWSDNGGQLPAFCANQPLQLRLVQSGVSGQMPQSLPYARTGTFNRRFFTVSYGVEVTLSLRCGTQTVGRYTRPYLFRWSSLDVPYPQVQLLQVPTQLDVVAGQPASLRMLFAGGASNQGLRQWGPPNQYDATLIEWQRSNDDGASWQSVAFSQETDADPAPISGVFNWVYWAVQHGFTPTAADHGSLLRARYCYTPPASRVPTAGTLPPACNTSPTVRVNVLAQALAPAITAPPQPVLVRTAETATFSADVTGLPAPTVRWETRPPGATGAWTDVTTGTGATTPRYTTPPLTLADNGRQYRIVAVNALGTATGASVTVSVSATDVAPTLTTQPTDLAVTEGNDAVFAVAARGTEALSYQWRFNGAPIGGANAAVYRLGGVRAGSGGEYSVEIRNAAGSVTSRPALLTVLPAGSTAPPVAPAIGTQPSAATVSAGNTATFAVGVNGSSPFGFQWRRDGTPIPGATSAAYTIASVSAADAGAYSVVVSNAAGSATSTAATLTLTAAAAPIAPSIGTQPVSLVQLPGSTATLAVAASGSAPLAYQWSRDGTPVAGATGPVLTLAGVGSADAGTYRVTVSNGVGSVNSDDVSVIVVGAPTVTSQPAAAVAAPGATATFSVVATGSSLRYLWLRDGLVIAGATAASYTTLALASADTGAVFSVVVYNGSGAALSAPAVLTVSAPSAFPAQAVPLRAMHPDFGQELWMTDGTANGTVFVADINPGATNSAPSQFTRLGGLVYFTANDGSSGRELWRSDGTAAGTARVIDLQPGAGGAFPVNLTACNGRLFFGADDGNSPGIYSSDGSAAGTVRLLNAVMGNSRVPFVCVNGVLYFNASTGAHGAELWRSDGTAGGTTLLADIVPGTNGSNPEELTEFLGQVVFSAANTLWRSDGTTAGTVQVSADAGTPTWLVVNGSTLYFSAVSAAAGREPWKSDGTAAGTAMIADLATGTVSSFPSVFTVSGGVTYFSASGSGYALGQLWRTDGTAAGTVLLTPGLRYVANYGDSIFDLNGTLYFSASASGSDVELWKSDGTAQGTVLVADIFAGSSGSYPQAFFRIGNTLHFAATTLDGAELWRSDGTAGGTVLVKDLCPASGCSGSPQLR